MKIPAKPKDFQLAPTGKYRGVLCDVIDLGEKDNLFKPGEKVAYAQLAFQTEHLMASGKPFVVRTYPFTQKLTKTAKLYKFIVAFRGKFTKEEEDEFDLDDLIGTNAFITVTHNPDKNGKLWANVEKAEPLPDECPADLKVRDYVRVQDWERNN